MFYTIIIALMLALWSTSARGQPLDVATPINVALPQAKNLQTLLVVRPGFMGGTRWVDLAHKQVATLTNMAPTGSATSGWGLTKRRGGLGELRFDGTNDYVDLGTSPVYSFTNMTFVFSAWVRATGAGYIVAQRQAAGTGGWMGRVNADGTVEFRVLDTGNSAVAGRLSVSTTAVSGAWFHVLAVMTTDTITAGNNALLLYINGRLDQGGLQTTGQAYSPVAYPLYLGSLSDVGGGSFLPGALDDVRLYRVGQAASQVSSIMNGSLLQRLPPLPFQLSAAAKRARGKVY